MTLRPPRRRPVRQRRRTERGASVVWFAAAVPVLAIAVLAVVDVRVDHDEADGVRHAAAMAAHHLETDRTAPGHRCSLTGAPTTTPATHDALCDALAAAHLHHDRVRVRLVVDRNGSGATVCVAADARAVTGLLAPLIDGGTHRGVAHARTGAALATAGERPLPGTTWAWCDRAAS